MPSPQEERLTGLNDLTEIETCNYGITQIQGSPIREVKRGLGIGIDHGFITEIQAYQDLMIDFESEFSQFLSQPIPQCTQENAINTQSPPQSPSQGRVSRRRSSASCGATNRQTIPYNIDGTISCCDITYSLLVIT